MTKTYASRPPDTFSRLQEMAKKGEDHRTNSDKSLSHRVVAAVSICWQPQASFLVFLFLYISFLTVFGAYTPYFLLANARLAQSGHLREAFIFGYIWVYIRDVFRFVSSQHQSIDMIMIVGLMMDISTAIPHCLSHDCC